MPTTSTAFRQLTDQSTPGTLFGATTTDVIGFWGVTSGTQKSTVNFATLSQSSGALSSSIAIALNALGIINATSVAG